MPQKVRYQRGQYVYRQGEGSRGLFRADTGLVRLVQLTPRGRTLTVRHVLPGDYFGEDTLTNPTHPHGAEALTNATITAFDPTELDERALLDVARNLGDQIQRTITHEVHLQSGDLRVRVVRYLLDLADTPLGAEDTEDRLYVRATHELLAEGSGSTRESVSKVITELRDAGLIETGYRHITLLRLGALREIATRAAQPGGEENA